MKKKTLLAVTFLVIFTPLVYSQGFLEHDKYGTRFSDFGEEGIVFDEVANEMRLKKCIETIEGICREFHENGQLSVEENYRNGQLNGYVRWYYENGNLATELNFKDDKKDGIEKRYFEDGGIISEKSYKNGKLHGKDVRYRADGKKQFEKSYREGKEHGQLLDYHENGNLKKESNYKGGSLYGKFKEYAEDGSLLLEMNYKDGQPDGFTKTYYDEKRLDGEPHLTEVPYQLLFANGKDRYAEVFYRTEIEESAYKEISMNSNEEYQALLDKIDKIVLKENPPPTIDFNKFTLLGRFINTSCVTSISKRKVIRDDENKIYRYTIVINQDINVVPFSCIGSETLNLITVNKIPNDYRIEFVEKWEDDDKEEMVAIEPSQTNETYIVEQLMDAATLKLTNGEIVKLIGIEIPQNTMQRERSESFIRNLVESNKIWLRFDSQKRDKDGALLAYVDILQLTDEGRGNSKNLQEINPGEYKLFLNAYIIAAGYATPQIIPPNTKYEDTFLQLHEKAKENQRGIWNQSRGYQTFRSIEHPKEGEGCQKLPSIEDGDGIIRINWGMGLMGLMVFCQGHDEIARYRDYVPDQRGDKFIGQIPDGIVKEYHKNGRLNGILNYKNNKLNGNAKFYFENGNLKSELNFKDNQTEGNTKNYYESGELLSEASFKNGEIQGITKSYYKNGALKGEKNCWDEKIGLMDKTYYQSGAIKSERDCIKHNVTSYYEDGTIKTEWLADVEKTRREYYDNGTIAEITKWYRDDTLKGKILGRTEREIFDTSGNLIYKGN